MAEMKKEVARTFSIFIFTNGEIILGIVDTRSRLASNKISKLLEDVMRRSYQKVPIPWLQGDSCVPLEPFLLLSIFHQ
jgi:hypothetical protein